MWPDRVSNPGPLTYESGALPTALRSPAVCGCTFLFTYMFFEPRNSDLRVRCPTDCATRPARRISPLVLTNWQTNHALYITYRTIPSIDLAH